MLRACSVCHSEGKERSDVQRETWRQENQTATAKAIAKLRGQVLLWVLLGSASRKNCMLSPCSMCSCLVACRPGLMSHLEFPKCRRLRGSVAALVVHQLEYSGQLGWMCQVMRGGSAYQVLPPSIRWRAEAYVELGQTTCACNLFGGTNSGRGKPLVALEHADLGRDV